MRLNEGHSCGVQHVDGQERIPSCAAQVNVKHVQSGGDCIKLSSVEDEDGAATYSVSVRNRKRKDPVQINLVNLIKVGDFIAWSYYYSVLICNFPDIILTSLSIVVLTWELHNQ
jgi:hypothetical protein